MILFALQAHLSYLTTLTIYSILISYPLIRKVTHPDRFMLSVLDHPTFQFFH
jgi:hypothetical protein